MTGDRLNLSGGCHCGNIRLRLNWPDAVGPTAFRHCTCSFCTKINARYCAHPMARLEIEIGKEKAVNRYRFGTMTSDFLVCKICGVMPAVTCDDNGSLMAVVNVNTLDDFTVDDDAVKPVSFEGEKTEGRLERRRKTWITDVSIACSDR